MICLVCSSFTAAGPTLCPRCGSALPTGAAKTLTITDGALARSLGGGLLLGRAFAFASKTAFQRPHLRWMERLLGGGARARPLVISLFDREPVQLPGVTMSPPDLPPLALGAVTSDRALYREGRDEVRLLALDPLAPGAEVTLEVRANGVDLQRQTARLDARGAASVSLRDLPVGDYEVRLRGALEGAPACCFTVAAHRLAPLVASLASRRLDGPLLAVTLHLESFGAPVSGKVKLELTDRGARLASVTVDAAAGVVEASFTIFGEGPHAIHVQLVSDAARTATVPLVGSRAAERSRTVLSPLGAEVTGSLQPSEGAHPVRGIFLEEGALRVTPFRLSRLDGGRARLTAIAAVETARVVIVDPTQPLRRPGAIDPTTAPHPAHADASYPLAERLFNAGQIVEARDLFEEARAAMATPHPNYAYFLACCHARLGDLALALASLHAAIRDGWSDFTLLGEDPDLAALRGHPGYTALLAGPREITLDDVAAGRVLDLDLPGPMALVVIGAWIDGEAWEGWATVLTKETITPTLTAPATVAPGGDAVIVVDTGRADDDASVYVVIKDARVLTADTPASRLAGGLKAFAEAAGRELAVGAPTWTLAAAIPTPAPPSRPSIAPRGRVSISEPPRMAPSSTRSEPPAARPRLGSSSSSRPAPSLPPLDAGFSVTPAPTTYAPPAPSIAPGSDRTRAPSRGKSRSLRPPTPSSPPVAALGQLTGLHRVAGAPPSLDEPEVLFAGLVATQGGRATVTVRLGGDFADYLASAFVITGTDWAPIEARFRAERAVFVALDLPAFVAAQDSAVGRVHVGALREGARVRVTRDGAEVPLYLDGLALDPGAPLPATRAELSFLASAGRWEATIEDPSGARQRTAKDVEIPGKIRRIARAVRVLQPGERLTREGDATLVGLRVLPGLDQPFHALLDATADYAHACCEQTAAKMLAASAMYALTDDPARRARAEAILLAGAAREEALWLRGRGFKMYPESGPIPDATWGKLASRHLSCLAFLRDLRGPAAPSRALLQAIDEALAMAADTARAYDLAWPPTAPRTCEEAYATLCFAPEAAHAAALDLVQQRANASPNPAGSVGLRAESAYAAAALLRSGGPSSRGLALTLANAVIDCLGPSGRLYSTVDSIAAIALMIELRAAPLLGGDAGLLEINGARVTTTEALEYAGSIDEVSAIEGAVAVEIARVVEDDWDKFTSKLALRVAIEKNGSPTRRLDALAAVDLVVKLEAGYVPGDVCWVCLPDALSRIVGGGQAKRFSVDFNGQDEVRIPLAATGVTVNREGKEAPAHFAVCVRNMFEEERGGNPGPISVTVLGPAGRGLLGRPAGV